MKPEIEYKYLIMFLNSPYKKGWTKENGGCKRNFEQFVNAPYKSKEFSEFFNRMVKKGCLEISKLNDLSNDNAKYFVINEKKIIEILSQNQIFSESFKFFQSRSLFDLEI